MSCENKIQEYISSLENDKLIIETHFANIEKITRENKKLEREQLIGLLSNFNTLNIQYDQLCNDLITFMKIFKPETEEIRLYKTDELIELLNQKANEVEN
ncbi:MAG: hypothetical protein J6B73_01800 [Methanobrevibacter sp.]|uniref:Uncharacterized protein n=1 Tax=Methanobrevibacter millerae TaxID=230361 RepID=A0A8T3VRW7_9EURY|nr:hypothetical protein [Methanobrevibacter sp.]MBE6510806.1 hypothetical protein [Methanobrevibacter millerae]MBO5150887.1 hypothetical protein [Methanobrevibacter sp.]